MGTVVELSSSRGVWKRKRLVLTGSFQEGFKEMPTLSWTFIECLLNFSNVQSALNLLTLLILMINFIS